MRCCSTTSLLNSFSAFLYSLNPSVSPYGLYGSMCICLVYFYIHSRFSFVTHLCCTWLIYSYVMLFSCTFFFLPHIIQHDLILHSFIQNKPLFILKLCLNIWTECNGFLIIYKYLWLPNIFSVVYDWCASLHISQWKTFGKAGRRWNQVSVSPNYWT